MSSAPGSTTDALASVFSSVAQDLHPNTIQLVNSPGGGAEADLLLSRSQPGRALSIAAVTSGLGQRRMVMGFEIVGSVARFEYGLFAADGSENPVEQLMSTSQDSRPRIGVWKGSVAEALLRNELGSNLAADFIEFDTLTFLNAALTAGDIGFFISPVFSSGGYVENADPVVVFSSERLKVLEDVPTAIELGWPIRKSTEYVLFSSPDTKPDQLADFENLADEIVNSQEFISGASRTGVTSISFRSSQATKDFIQTPSNEYCENCDCNEQECRRNCVKCD